MLVIPFSLILSTKECYSVVTKKTYCCTVTIFPRLQLRMERMEIKFNYNLKMLPTFWNILEERIK